MTDAWHSLKLKRFERVEAAPTVALLRITGKGPRRSSTIGERPRLAADDGDAVRRFVPIPAPPDTDRGLLRAAYSVPSPIITGQTVFSLEFPDGAVIPLPPPTAGDGRIPGALVDAPSRPARADDPDPDPPRLGDEERRDELLPKLAELSGALADSERSLADAEAARATAEGQTESARAEVQQLTARIAQLESGAASAGEAHSSLQSQIDGAEQRARAAEERLEATALELLAARETADGVEALRRRNAELEETAERHQEVVRGLELDLIAARESVSPMQMEIETLRTTRALKERELHDALDSVRKMTLERDELSRQAAAFDAVAIKARERATQAESAAQNSKSVLDELETWRGELERRLASMSAELGAARARIREDERHIELLRGQLIDANARIQIAEAQVAAAGGADPALARDTEIKRLATELATVRAEHARSEQERDEAEQRRAAGPDPEEQSRIIESQRAQLAAQAEELSRLLAPADELAELARQLAEARALADSLQAAAARGDSTQAAPTSANGSAAHGRPAHEAAAIETIISRAERQAAEQAARELAAELRHDG